MKNRSVLTGIFGLGLALVLVGCNGGGGGAAWYDKDIWMDAATAPTAAATLPASADLGSEVAVHDPSVFYDSDTNKYYAFGTHYAVASSTDLIKWTQEARDGQDTVLYGTSGSQGVLTQMAEELNLSGTVDTWAPDVMKIGDTYYMYVSATEGFGSSHSMIVRVSSTRGVMGPYSKEEVIVKSFGEGGQPNCIDPELFYDKEGKLWMVYGSFYTGIFVKELDKNGLPVVSDEFDENYYGTMLWAGGSNTRGGEIVEGPFIFYNAENDYYYLMTTYGELANDYNMRVARSKSPNGPYTDISGSDLTQYSDSVGVKLAGNYRFDGDQQRKALGHNSVIKKDGKYLVVCHARNNAGAHHVEVHQLFFNKDGWPVMSPDRYVGESLGMVTAEQLAGDYDVIVHTAGTVEDYANSVKYTLTADGKIKDGETDAGTWSLSDGYYCTVTLGGVTYQGVVAPAWKAYGTKKGIYCMTATSDAGLPIWFNAN